MNTSIADVSFDMAEEELEVFSKSNYGFPLGKPDTNKVMRWVVFCVYVNLYFYLETKWII